MRTFALAAVSACAAVAAGQCGNPILFLAGLEEAEHLGTPALIVGALRDDPNGSNSGSASVFVLSCCSADVNGDDQLNILDFVSFQLLWQHGDAAADCDDNAAFNVLDFVCFQQLFVQRCP